MARYTHIYLLISKLHDKVYIGSTNMPKERLSAHLSTGTMGNKGFLDRGDIEMEILDVVPEIERFKREKHYLSLFKKIGFELVNQMDVSQRNPLGIKKNTKKFSREELMWVSQLRMWGDARIISEDIGEAYGDVYKAVQIGVMTPELYKKIIKFYKKRERSQINIPEKTAEIYSLDARVIEFIKMRASKEKCSESRIINDMLVWAISNKS